MVETNYLHTDVRKTESSQHNANYSNQCLKYIKNRGKGITA